MNQKINHLGFSLLEILITMSLVAILSLLANAAYTHFTNHAQRLAAEQTLLRAAAALERYALVHGNYDGANLSDELHSTPGYELNANITATTYTLTASPNKNNHDTCGRLSINENHDTVSDFANSACFAT